MHIHKNLISAGKQVIRTPEQKEEFRKLYSEYRRLKSPFKKASNINEQIVSWNQLSWTQKNNDAAFYCGHQTALLGERQAKLPVFKQLNSIGRFFENISEKITLCKIKLHNAKLKLAFKIANFRKK